MQRHDGFLEVENAQSTKYGDINLINKVQQIVRNQHVATKIRTDTNAPIAMNNNDNNNSNENHNNTDDKGNNHNNHDIDHHIKKTRADVPKTCCPR